MASTPLLGLSLPADGTTNWGALVNTSITALIDSAVAGTTTLLSDTDVILSSVAEASNEARQAIIVWNAGGSLTRTITAPGRSKTYVVVNATTTQSIVFRGANPTPTVGVTIPAGSTYVLVWNGADFVAAYSDYVSASTVQTLTNKEIVKRVVTVADANTITPDIDTSDIVAQANSLATLGTLTINAPTGSAVNGQAFVLRISSAAVQTFAWNAIYQGSTDLSLPSTTSGAGKTDYLGFIYNSTAVKWQVLAKNFGF